MRPSETRCGTLVVWVSHRRLLARNVSFFSFFQNAFNVWTRRALDVFFCFKIFTLAQFSTVLNSRFGSTTKLALEKEDQDGKRKKNGKLQLPVFF